MELNSELAEKGVIIMYIKRASEEVIKKMLSMFKVVLVTGPRQVGKSTMLKHVLGEEYTYITLDDINELELAKSDPKLFFLNHSGKLIIDEVQYAPELFVEIKRIVDLSDETGTIVLTGSQTYSLMNNVSESLAGRIGILELCGLSMREIRNEEFDLPFIPSGEYLEKDRLKTNSSTLWNTIHKGSMPELYRNKEMDLQLYYAAYVKTYIERDVRELINVKDLNIFSRFIVALAARTSQLLNYSAIANELGVDSKTIKSWVGILESSGIVITLQPFSNNNLSRVIKTPMLYFMDTGLVCYLLKWLTADTLQNGAMSGPILETYVVSELIKSFKNKGILNPPVYFYRDKDMKEIDVVIEDSGILYPIEIKKSAIARKEMVKNFSVLDKAVGYKIGCKVILCLIDKKMYLDDDIIAYPITEI